MVCVFGLVFVARWQPLVVGLPAGAVLAGIALALSPPRRRARASGRRLAAGDPAAGGVSPLGPSAPDGPAARPWTRSDERPLARLVQPPTADDPEQPADPEQTAAIDMRPLLDETLLLEETMAIDIRSYVNDPGYGRG